MIRTLLARVVTLGRRAEKCPEELDNLRHWAVSAALPSVEASHAVDASAARQLLQQSRVAVEELSEVVVRCREQGELEADVAEEILNLGWSSAEALDLELRALS